MLKCGGFSRILQEYEWTIGATYAGLDIIPVYMKGGGIEADAVFSHLSADTDFIITQLVGIDDAARAADFP